MSFLTFIVIISFVILANASTKFVTIPTAKDVQEKWKWTDHATQLKDAAEKACQECTAPFTDMEYCWALFRDDNGVLLHINDGKDGKAATCTSIAGCKHFRKFKPGTDTPIQWQTLPSSCAWDTGLYKCAEGVQALDESPNATNGAVACTNCYVGACGLAEVPEADVGKAEEIKKPKNAFFCWSTTGLPKGDDIRDNDQWWGQCQNKVGDNGSGGKYTKFEDNNHTNLATEFAANKWGYEYKTSVEEVEEAD